MITCGTPGLINILRDALVMYHSFVREWKQALKPFFGVAALMFTQRILRLVTLGSKLLKYKSIRSQRQAAWR